MSNVARNAESRYAIRMMIVSFILGCLVCVTLAQIHPARGDEGQVQGQIHPSTKSTIVDGTVKCHLPAERHQDSMTCMPATGGAGFPAAVSSADRCGAGYETYRPHPTLVSRNVRLQI